jgi:O-succinylhomoserine sulfhydrylase
MSTRSFGKPALASPFNAWVLLKGLETLAVRVRRRPIRRQPSLWRPEHPKVGRLIYPPARSSVAEIVQRQMHGGSTLLASRSGGKAAAFRFRMR